VRRNFVIGCRKTHSIRDRSDIAPGTTPLPSNITFTGTGRSDSFLKCRKHARDCSLQRAQLVQCELANSDLTRPAIKFVCLSGT
jgi:hypothetical protein